VMQFILTNQSTQCEDSEVERIAQALQLQLALQVAPAWDRMPPTVSVLPADQETPSTPVPTDVVRIWIMDDPPSVEEAGVLGYHTEGPNGQPYSYVFATPILNAGGGVLDPGRANASVAATVSHEAIEAFGDVSVNDWIDGPTRPQGSCYAKELSDPLESSLYPITLPDGTKVHVSGFACPGWFDMQSPAGVARTIPDLGLAPFELAPGGYYVIRREPGTEQSVFHSVLPAAWRLATKQVNPCGRTKRRTAPKAG